MRRLFYITTRDNTTKGSESKMSSNNRPKAIEEKLGDALDIVYLVSCWVIVLASAVIVYPVAALKERLTKNQPKKKRDI